MRLHLYLTLVAAPAALACTPSRAPAPGASAAEPGTVESPPPAEAPAEPAEPAEPPAEPDEPPAEAESDAEGDPPPKLGPVDTTGWSQIDLTALSPPCARLGKPRAGEQLCRNVTREGHELDEMTTDETGTLEIRDGAKVVRTIPYDRVFSDGAAGSMYETFFQGQTPVLMQRSCMVTDEAQLDAGWEGYAPCEVRLPPRP
jgi:hypothetical protein